MNNRKRSRATAEQLSKMVDFMYGTPALATAKFLKLHGKFEFDKKWSELAAILNSLDGPVKTTDQWHTVWRDLKSRTIIKFRNRRKQLMRSGKTTIYEESVSDIKRRVVALVGTEYGEDHELVQENVIIKEEIQLSPDEENDSIFSDIPSSPSTPINDVDYETSNTPTKRTKQACRKRKRLEDYSDTQAKLLEISKTQANAAKSNSDALKMIAECNVAIIQSNKMMADAIKIMGEGLKNIADVFNNLANSLNKLSANGEFTS